MRPQRRRPTGAERRAALSLLSFPQPLLAHSRTLALLGALIALAVFLTPRTASAQAEYFYLDRAQISGAPDDGFMVWRPYMHEETRFYGFAALGYSHNPLRNDTVARDTRTADRIDNPVEGQLNTYFVIGTEIARRVALNVAIPVLLYGLYGDDPLSRNIGEGGIGDSTTALYDLRFDGRVRVYESDNRKLRLGFGGALFVDAGDSSAFASDDSGSGWLFMNGEYDLGKFLVAGMLGPHFRPERSMGGSAAALFMGNEMRWAFGGYMPLRDGKVRLGVELWGTTGIESAGPREQSTTFTTRNLHLEWLGQARFALGRDQHTWAMGGVGTRLSAGYGAPDFRMLVSIGHYLTIKDTEPKQKSIGFRGVPDVDDYARDTDKDGFPDDIDQCPTIKEDGQAPDPSDGCPAGSDRDKDGIPDDADACPDVPEDKDGVKDHDGCPEEDADNDKIPDVEDKCPTDIGPRSADAEKNGCPRFIKEGEGEVALLEPIQFEFGKAAIKAVSFPILDEVVAVMQAREGLRIGVYGHTDSVGSDARNLQLSKDRAASVMQYLVNKGIAKSRLESEGFGETKPIGSNDTDMGRAKNRRVEFKILGE